MNLSFRLLGTTNIYIDGRPLKRLRSPKAIALLVYLAHTGQVASRDFLAEFLWPARPPRQVRSNLRTLLSRLRKQIGDDALVITRDTVALSPSARRDVDSVHLLERMAAVDRVDGADAATRLRKALDGYQGPFLAGFSLPDAPDFEQWAMSVREQIHHQVLAAYRRLVRYLLAAGHLDEGIALAHRWLEVDPLDEDAHSLLIQLLLQADRRGAAVAHYNEAANRLQTELGVPPPADMTALIQGAQSRRPPSPPRRSHPGHNLPAVYDPFIGRTAEQGAIHRRMDQPWCRLVTVTGPGGVGKTRLAIAVAHSRLGRYRDGVWFVPLENIDPEDPDVAEAIAVEIATVLGFRLSGPGTPTSQVLRYLRPRQLLLVLDNFEPLLDGGVQLVLELIQACSEVQLLVTSREPLRLRAEWLILLSGLDHVSDVDRPGVSDAVTLFQTRQEQQKWLQTETEDLQDIQEICRLVGGLPLAIELAAGLTSELSPQEIAARLQKDLDLLQSTAQDTPARHRNLRAVFEMSWQALDAHLQQALARLSVFRGGFTPAAAQHVAQVDGAVLDALTAKSLLVFMPEETRYHLHPVIRAYAAEKLPADDPTPRRHTRYYLAWLLQFREELRGEGCAPAMAQIETDLDNIRTAFRHELRQKEIDLLQVALPLLADYYRLQGLSLEGEAFMHTARRAAMGWGPEGAPLAIQSGLDQARFRLRLGRYWQAIAVLESVLDLARQNGDRRAEGMAHIWWGEALWRLGDLTAAREKLNHAWHVGQALDDRRMLAWAHQQLGVIDDIQGAFRSALAHLEAARVLWQELNHLPALNNTLNSIGLVYAHQGELVQARQLFEEALALSIRLDNRHLQGLLLHNLGLVATEQGDHRSAQEYLSQALTLARACGNLTAESEILVDIGRNHLHLGATEAAVEALERASQLAHTLQDRRTTSSALLILARARRAQHRWDQAKRLYEEALAQAQIGQLHAIRCEILVDMADLLRQRDGRQARELLGQALALAPEIDRPDLVEQVQAMARQLGASPA